MKYVQATLTLHTEVWEEDTQRDQVPGSKRKVPVWIIENW